MKQRFVIHEERSPLSILNSLKYAYANLRWWSSSLRAHFKLFSYVFTKLLILSDDVSVFIYDLLSSPSRSL